MKNNLLPPNFFSIYLSIYGRNALFRLNWNNHMKRIGIKILLIIFLCAIEKTEAMEITNSMIQQPELYIKITDWSVYGTWSAVGIIHHVTIENTSDIAYKNIKVRVYYTSTSTAQQAIIISQETGILPITLPPHSKNTYLKGGTTLGAESQFMNPTQIEVIGATPVTE